MPARRVQLTELETVGLASAACETKSSRWCSATALVYLCQLARNNYSKRCPERRLLTGLNGGKSYEGRVVDAIHDSDDPLPAVFDIASRVGEYMRYPRKFLADMAFKQTHVLAAVTAGCGVL